MTRQPRFRPGDLVLVDGKTERVVVSAFEAFEEAKLGEPDDADDPKDIRGQPWYTLRPPGRVGHGFVNTAHEARLEQPAEAQLGLGL